REVLPPERVRPLGLAPEPDRSDAMGLSLALSDSSSGMVVGGVVMPALANRSLRYQKPTTCWSYGTPYCFPLTCQPAAALPSVPIQPDTYWVRSASLPDWIWVAPAPPPHC